MSQFSGTNADRLALTIMDVGSTFIETDTGNKYEYRGATAGWVLISTGDGAASVAVNAIDATLLPAEKSYTMWLIGGELVTTTITASGTGTYGTAMDISKIDFDEAAIHLINTGTGTAVLDLQVSRDGYSNPITISGVATQAGAGATAFKLNSAAMLYGHYVTARVRETGGANSAVVKCCLIGRGG